MLGFEALAGGPLASAPSMLLAPDDLDGAAILHVPARRTLAVVEPRVAVVGVAARLAVLAVDARPNTIQVPARQTLIEVTRGR